MLFMYTLSLEWAITLHKESVNIYAWIILVTDHLLAILSGKASDDFINIYTCI